MLNTIRASLAIACLLAAAIASTANANRIQLRPGGSITLTSLGLITFHSSLYNISCSMTLRGRLAGEAVENTSGTRIGEIDGLLTICEQIGEWTALSLPWPMRLTAAYSGTRVEFTIAGMSWLIHEIFGGLECLYGGNENASIAVASSITGLVTSAGNQIRNVGNAFCPTEGDLQGTFSLEPHQTISTI